MRARREEIHKLIRKQHPIVMGGNNMADFGHVDYHAFTNRKRAIAYAHTINPTRSRALFGAYLPEWIIKERYTGPYERIMYVNDHERSFDIRDGIVSASCRTVSVLLIGVALVMGAERIFVAGLDGYGLLLAAGEDTHHYTGQTDHGPDPNNKEAYLMDIERYQFRFLDEISQYMAQRGKEPFRIVTPTVYENHYQDISSYL